MIIFQSASCFNVDIFPFGGKSLRNDRSALLLHEQKTAQEQQKIEIRAVQKGKSGHVFGTQKARRKKEIVKTSTFGHLSVQSSKFTRRTL